MSINLTGSGAVRVNAYLRKRHGVSGWLGGKLVPVLGHFQDRYRR
jgi:hypothetical protein